MLLIYPHSGAIDIIVIKHEDDTLRSSPFHVRFGKLQLLRSRETIVSITVNNQPCNFTMKLGPAGEGMHNMNILLLCTHC